jgi:hypothetical protein
MSQVNLHYFIVSSKGMDVTYVHPTVSHFSIGDRNINESRRFRPGQGKEYLAYKFCVDRTATSADR